jgi:hypothetical protein
MFVLITKQIHYLITSITFKGTQILMRYHFKYNVLKYNKNK